MRRTLQVAKSELEKYKKGIVLKHGYSANLILHFDENDPADVLKIPLRNLTRDQFEDLQYKNRVELC